MQLLLLCSSTIHQQSPPCSTTLMDQSKKDDLGLTSLADFGLLLGHSRKNVQAIHHHSTCVSKGVNKSCSTLDYNCRGKGSEVRTYVCEYNFMLIPCPI